MALNDIRELTLRLEEDILDDPTPCCCVPYSREAVKSAPCDLAPSRRLELPATGVRVMGQHPANLELYPSPNRPIPRIKTELRGSKLYPACECIKRNGLQDSCPSYRCMVVFHQAGCTTLPMPTCALGQRQLSKLAALPNRMPEYCRAEQPTCSSETRVARPKW